MKNKSSFLIGLLLCAAAFLFTGCGTPGKYGQVMQTSTWGFGINVAATDAATGTPKIQLGAFKTTVTYLPTSTNSPIYTPRFASSYHSQQNAYNPTSADTTDNIMAGDVQTGTNSEATAIVPKSGPPAEFWSK